MSKKFWTTLALATAVAFTPSATHTVFAGAGEWDLMNQSADEVFVSSYSGGTGQIISSGGGDYKVQLTANGTGGELTIQLWEADGSDPANDDYIGYRKITSPGEVVFTNLNNFVDGEKAELYIRVYTTGGSGYTYFRYYD